MYLDLAQDKPVKFNLIADVAQNSNILNTDNTRSNRNRLLVNQTITGTGIPSSTKITNLVITTNNKIRITLSNNYTGATRLKANFTVESLNAAEYGSFAFTPQLVYSRNGLKLSHILNGNVENSTITYDGILYDTGYTIGTIDGDIDAKYRSNIQLNNISKYQAIKTLAESFDAIAIFNSVNKTVSFYPDKNESVFTNNGLIITKENYLKDLTNDIDASKIVTKAYAAGKDNLPIALITPNGENAWEDYSYYLDSFYVEYPSEETTQLAKETAIAASGVVIANDSLNNINNNTGVNFTSFPTGSLARYIDSTEALKIAKWQYARDYFHDIMLGQFNPAIAEHDRYFDLYNLRSAALNSFVKEESKYFELKATEYRYKYAYDLYVKENDNLADNTRQKTFIYKFDSSTTVGDPGNNDFRLNNASFSGVTKILIDDLDNSNVDRRAFLAGITVNKNPQIVLADKADVDNGTPINYVFYQIDSIESPSGYIVLNVTYLNKTGAGTTFTNTNPTNLYFLTWEEIYKNKYDEAIAASTFALAELNKFHYNLYNTRFDGTQAESTDSDYAALVTTIQPNSFASKISEVQGFLNKFRWSIDEEKLKPFIKEAVMSDSNLDNELDLLNTTREYLIENSKPIVTLSIGVLDFLASEQSSVDWNKVKIGEIVNIYFPDFNVDTTAQLREISIDFQQNSLSFVISTYRQYTRVISTYVMRQIRKTYDNQTNKLGFQYDNNNIGSNRANLVNRKLIKAGFSSEQAPIKLGAKSSDGSTSTEISGEGIISQVIGVDPVLETFIYKNEKTLQIADGTLIARNLVRDESDVLVYKTEVEVSGDNGFVIRKINPNGDVLPQVYIDTNGNAIFAGALSAATGTFAGELSAATGSFTGSIAIGAEDSIFKADSNGIYLGDADFADAEFSVTPAGLLKAISGSIGGWTIGNTTLSSSNIKIVSGDNPYISIGQDIEGYQQAGTYIGDAFLGGTAVPTFSVGDVDVVEEEDFEGSYTQGDTAIGNWTSSLGVYLDYSTAPSNSFVIDDQNITTGAGQTWNLNNPTGHYFLLKGWDNTNSIAGLLEFTIPNNEEDYLLEFNAHVGRIGGSPGDVALEVRDDSLSTSFIIITGFPFFNKYQVKIPARSTDKIVFRFTKSTSALGLIALDNIKLDKVSGISYDSNDGLKVNGGNIGGFDIGALKLTGGTSSFLKNYLGLSVGSGTSNNIAFWAGAEGNSAAQISNALFRVTQTGALTSTSGNIGGFTIGSDFIRSGADNTKLLLKHDTTNPFMSIGQSTNGYAQPGIFLGLDSADNNSKFSINPTKIRTFNTTFGSTTLTGGDTTNLTPGMVITGTGMLEGTYIESITDSTTLEMTGTANTTGTASLSFTNGLFSFDGTSLNVGAYNFSALGLSGSGSVTRASLSLLYNIRLDYDEFYMKSDAAGPSSYDETFIKANSLKAARFLLSPNPTMAPSSYTTGTLSSTRIIFDRQNYGVNSLFGSIAISANNLALGQTRIYNLPNVGADAEFVMTQGAQTIAGTKTFSSTISGSIDGSAASISTGSSTSNVNFSGSTAFVFSSSEFRPATGYSRNLGNATQFFLGVYTCTIYRNSEAGLSDVYSKKDIKNIIIDGVPLYEPESLKQIEITPEEENFFEGVKTLFEKLSIYTFNYIGSETNQPSKIGVMAQEIEEILEDYPVLLSLLIMQVTEEIKDENDNVIKTQIKKYLRTDNLDTLKTIMIKYIYFKVKNLEEAVKQANETISKIKYVLINKEIATEEELV
jgi:hypothetical protein